jgi:hypothetical protein
MDTHYGLKSLREKRLKISRIDELNDPFELLPYDLSNKNNRRALDKTRKQLGEKHGLLCFGGTWHDPVMWAHYGDKHRGLCLGFEIPADSETFRRVHYMAVRLPFPRTPSLADAEAILFTKYSNWAYEQEIRVWVQLDASEAGLYFYDFNDSLKLAEVIIGQRSPVSRDELKQALGNLAKNVQLIKARSAFTEFKIVRQQRSF